MTFEQFMSEVDNIMSDNFGMTTSDIEDYPWNDYFEEDFSDDEAKSAIAEAVAIWAYDHGFNGNPDNYYPKEWKVVHNA